MDEMRLMRRLVLLLSYRGKPQMDNWSIRFLARHVQNDIKLK